MYQILKSSDSANNIISTREQFNGMYQLHSFVFTNNIYNITSNNNIVPYQEGATYTALELTQQFANGDTIATDLQTKINAVSAGTASVSFDDNTGKLTISNTTNFYFKFGDITSNTAYKQLGFEQSNTTDGTSAVSTNAVDLVPFKHIYIDIKQDQSQSIKNENYRDYSFIINANSNFGEKCHYNAKNNDYNPQICKFRNENRLEIRFYNENYNAITPTNWELVLFKL